VSRSMSSCCAWSCLGEAGGVSNSSNWSTTSRRRPPAGRLGAVERLRQLRRSGHDQGPLIAARQLPGRQRWQHPGLHQRRLPGTGGAEQEHSRPVGGQPGQDPLDGDRATVEPLGVLGGEGLESPVRAGLKLDRAPPSGPCRRHLADHPGVRRPPRAQVGLAGAGVQGAGTHEGLDKLPRRRGTAGELVLDRASGVRRSELVGQSFKITYGGPAGVHLPSP
jgi:hypothetical protein